MTHSRNGEDEEVDKKLETDPGELVEERVDRRSMTIVAMTSADPGTETSHEGNTCSNPWPEIESKFESFSFEKRVGKKDEKW